MMISERIKYPLSGQVCSEGDIYMWIVFSENRYLALIVSGFFKQGTFRSHGKGYIAAADRKQLHIGADIEESHHFVCEYYFPVI